MSTNFRLVAKFLTPHVVDVGIVYPNGSCFTVARVAFPEDFQIADTTKCIEDIISILRKRYRGSV